MMLDLVAKAQGTSKPLPVISKKRKIGPLAVLYTYKYNQYSLRELSDMSGISWQALRKRIDSGWSVDDAMTRPIYKRKVK